jgi:nicotinate-nucleotide adenylyltransferase
MNESKICIFGGSFNPPTVMHLATAERVLDRFNVDKVIFEPVGNAYQKATNIDSKDRINMVNLMIRDAKNDRLELGTYEASLSYAPDTIETLRYYKNKYKNSKIYLLVGSDNLESLPDWPGGNEILTDFNVICMQRNTANVHQDIIVTHEALYRNEEKIHIIYENIMNNVSSSMVRASVKADKGVSAFVFPSIKEYIMKNELYK